MNATLAWLAAPLLAAPTFAQVTFQGDAPSAQLGDIFDVVGDLDGDGVEDLVAGLPGHDGVGADSGRVLVLSGSDGSTIRTHFGATAGDRYGSQVASAGLVDSDLVPDYMVGAEGFGAEKGAVSVYSGATGALIHDMRGFAAGDRLGAGMARAGDVDGDGREDLILGAPGVDELTSESGVVYVVSGATSAPLLVLANGEFETEFGQFVAGLGDVNGDGVPDLLASAPDLLDVSGGNGGFSRVISGADGATLRQHNGYDDGHGTTTHIGVGLSGVGDLDGDGVGDYAIGVLVWWSGFQWSFDFNEGKQIEFHSGATGAWIPGFGVHYEYDDSFYPIQPNDVGDVNGDGVSDIAYVTPAEEHVKVISGATREILQVIAVPEGATRFGDVIRGVADVTGDGLRDLAIGMPALNGPAGLEAGGIRFLPVETCPQPTNYCTAIPTSSGFAASISSFGTTSVAVNDFVLRASGCPANKPGLFFYGPNQVSLPYGDGVLCVGTGGGGYFRVQPTAMTNPQGVATQPIDNTTGIFASGPGQLAPGTTWNFQFWLRDPQGGPNGFTFSDGLSVSFCP